jgi:hypothetical protein
LRIHNEHDWLNRRNRALSFRVRVQTTEDFNERETDERLYFF